jgi:hypothetical protein
MEQFIGKNNISHVYSINERGIPLNNIDKISLEKFVSFINPAMERESAVLEGTDHTALASVIDIQRISEIFRGESAGEILRASYGKAPDTQELQRFYALLENL